MKKHPLAAALSRAALLAMFATAPVLAQDVGVGPSPDDQAKDLDKIVVQGEISYRDRSADIAPTLVYDLEYFQRFEPDTVGDMLKRVPGVAFVDSDVMEFDQVALRGLGGGYTQVLINGKKVPGAGDDRSFYVDRIPAEMVDHIEIKRSASANRSGDAMAGAVNIVLRDAYLFDGSYIKVGANRYFDGEINPTFGAVTSGEFAGGRILAGVGVQDRYRAKDKLSERYSDPSLDELTSIEEQVEVKDGRDISGNLSYTANIGESGRFSIDGFYTKTDRDLTEVSTETEFDDGEIDGVSSVPGLGTWDQKNWGIGAEYRQDVAGGALELDLDHTRFDNIETGWEQAASEDEVEEESEGLSSNDKETGFKVAYKRDMGGETTMEFGVDYRKKQRDSVYSEAGYVEVLEDGEWVVDEDEATFTYSDINEKRIDPYIQFNGQRGIFAWEAGIRYETTKTDIDYLIEGYENGELDDTDGPFTAGKDYNFVLPSASLRWDLTDSDRVTFSVARTVKRPNFRHITPTVYEGEFEDNDLAGNPDLEPETSTGFDLGFEHRIGRKGVVGINVFYRDVKDLTELVNTGDYSDEYSGLLEDLEDAIEDGDEDDIADAQEELDDAAPTFIYQYQNVGDGKVYGVELDLSAPITDNLGVFLNYAYLNSKITDFVGERRFNSQAKSVYNIGFIQSLPSLNASFGASYHKQGDNFSRMVGEELLVRYDGDLELFVEKNFGKKVSVRLSAQNLLDAEKYEEYSIFTDAESQLNRDYDEFEIEREQAGPRYQLVMRWAF